jgi:hypothetical protein
VPPRLVFAGLDLLDRQHAQLALLLGQWRGIRTIASEQGIEPTPKPTFFCSGHAYSW